MATIRELKKDVEFMVGEVVSDGYTCLMINNQVDKDKVINIIESAVELQNDFIEKINHPTDKHDAKAVKQYYKQLTNELYVAIDELFNRLSGLLATK